MHNQPMKAPPTSHVASPNAVQHDEWIAGRVKVLLSHYFQPNMPRDQEEAAMDDWIDLLEPYSQDEIQDACRQYLSTEPRVRPTPGAILSILNRGYSEADLTVHQKSFLRDGLVPPSMQVDGKPNRAARHWLKIYRGIEA